MIPETSQVEVVLDHLQRYRFAASYAARQRVLDIACGEGYGTAALSRAGATSVIGIDVDVPTVEHARRKYGEDIRIGQAEEICLPNGSVELVVSFETIEHLDNPAAFLREAHRVLTPGGRLIISTPDIRFAAGMRNNPYHLHEMSEQEFRGEIKNVFKSAEWFGQRTVTADLLSFRGLAAGQTVPPCRAWSGLIRRLRPWLCSESDAKLSTKCRINPIDAITGYQPSIFDKIFSQSLVRRSRSSDRDCAIYLLAVATR